MSLVSLSSTPNILDGEVCFTGTRIPVSAVWSFASDGYGPLAIKEEYPSLSVDQIEAALSLVAWRSN